MSRAYPGFCGAKLVGVFLLPWTGRLSLPRNLLGFPVGTHSDYLLHGHYPWKHQQIDASMVTNVDNGTDVEVAVFVIFFILENDLKYPSENDAYSRTKESDV